jgi:hypothetical protein
VSDIINSLDYQGNSGLNFEQYMLLKRIVIGYRQYNINGLLDKNAFMTAFKTTFADKIIDEMDSELAFRMGIYLMSKKVDKNELNFIEYFELCRIVSNYYTFGVTIGEGYLTKSQLITGDYKLASNVTASMFEKYFNLFAEDIELQVNLDNTKIDPNLLKFEDYCSIDFWVNIISNYTDPNMNLPSLNLVGLSKLVSNKYFKGKYTNYLANSNFEDFKLLNSTVVANNNNTDYDFLTNFNFIQLNSKTKSFLGDSKAQKTSVFEQLGHKASLFEQFKQNDPASVLDTVMTNYFKIIDIDGSNLITFEEFITFIKYLQVYERFNRDNKDPRGIISSNVVNGNFHIYIVINQYQVYPRLTLSETVRLQNFDSLLCISVDFLIFFDYLIGPKVFRPYIINKSFVDEISIIMTLQKLNLYASVQQNRNYSFIMGNKVNYDYEGFLKM